MVIDNAMIFITFVSLRSLLLSRFLKSNKSMLIIDGSDVKKRVLCNLLVLMAMTSADLMQSHVGR